MGTLTLIRVMSNIILWFLGYRIKEKSTENGARSSKGTKKQTILRSKFASCDSLILLHTLEHLTVNQGVLGSSPRGAATRRWNFLFYRFFVLF